MEYKLCKRGHVRSPDNIEKGSNGCKQCRRDKYKEQHKNDIRKSLKKEYCKNGHLRSPENLVNRACKLCRETWIIDHRKKYNQLPEVKKRQKERQSSEHYKNVRKKYFLKYNALEKNSTRRKKYYEYSKSNLLNWYVAHRLQVSVKIVSENILDIKRSTILLQRGIKKWQSNQL
jgi:hypothetical protein